MLVEKNIPIRMSDGLPLRADVFRPDVVEQRLPVILTHGPYGKDIHFRDFRPSAWTQLVTSHPEVTQGTTARHMNWETVDPERWVPFGYAVVRVDSRGSGRSPGVLDLYSARDLEDMCESLAWASEARWSNGRVGMLGISYYATAQWRVAARRPQGLAAIIPWEGWSDSYRDRAYHGGIFSAGFYDQWFHNTICSVQHGNPNPPGDTGGVSGPTGPAVLTDEELEERRVNFFTSMKEHPLDDDWHQSQSADLAEIDVPLFSAGNLGGLGLHLRGNVEGFVQAGTSEKWLQLHTGAHWEEFYLDRAIARQRRFFDRFLKLERNGWDQEPRVTVAVRKADEGEDPHMLTGADWPLPGTEWHSLFLDCGALGLASQKPRSGRIDYRGSGQGVTFLSPPLEDDLTILGPAALDLWVMTEAPDMDVFTTLRAFDRNHEEITFRGASAHNIPLSQGWLRGSHRALDKSKSTSWRPYHLHDARRHMEPDHPTLLKIELWPTSVELPAGSRLALTVGPQDFEQRRNNLAVRERGSGPFLHEERAGYEGGSVLSGGEHGSRILLPIVEGQIKGD